VWADALSVGLVGLGLTYARVLISLGLVVLARRSGIFPQGEYHSKVTGVTLRWGSLPSSEKDSK